MFGLLSIAVTFTYLPPICSSTFAYSFSAATAAIGEVGLAPLEDAEAEEPEPPKELLPHPARTTASSNARRHARPRECAGASSGPRAAIFIGDLNQMVDSTRTAPRPGPRAQP